MIETVKIDGKDRVVNITEPLLSYRKRWVTALKTGIENKSMFEYLQIRDTVLKELTDLTDEEIEKLTVMDAEKVISKVENERLNLGGLKDFLSKQSPSQKQSQETKEK